MSLGDVIETYCAALAASFPDESTIYNVVSFLLARDSADRWWTLEN